MVRPDRRPLVIDRELIKLLDHPQRAVIFLAHVACARGKGHTDASRLHRLLFQSTEVVVNAIELADDVVEIRDEHHVVVVVIVVGNRRAVDGHVDFDRFVAHRTFQLSFP